MVGGGRCGGKGKLEIVGTSDFVAQLDRSVGTQGIHYLKLESRVRAVLWDWDLNPVGVWNKLWVVSVRIECKFHTSPWS